MTNRPPAFTPLTELTLDIPTDWWMSNNDRIHRMDEQRRTRWLRQLAATQARAQKIPTGLPTPVRVMAYISYPTRSTPDPGNAYRTTKALVDGLTDHGCWEDDNHHHVKGPDHRYGGVTPHRRTVRLVIYPIHLDEETERPHLRDPAVAVA